MGVFFALASYCRWVSVGRSVGRTERKYVIDFRRLICNDCADDERRNASQRAVEGRRGIIRFEERGEGVEKGFLTARRVTLLHKLYFTSTAEKPSLFRLRSLSLSLPLAGKMTVQEVSMLLRHR